MSCNILKAIFLLTQIIYLVNAHGRLRYPLARGELCLDPRNNKTTTCNDADWRFCDFVAFQYYYRGGYCHVCGKNYNGLNVTTGHKFPVQYIFAEQTGPISATYNSGDKISLTAWIGGHPGYMRVRLCKMDGKKEATQSCFNENLLRLEVTHETHLVYLNETHHVKQLDSFTLSTPVNPKPSGKEFNSTFNAYLPTGLDCQNCILQWEWHTTDQTAVCMSFTGAVQYNKSFNPDYNDSPCVSQIFRTCVDIKIKPVENQPEYKSTPFIIKNKEKIFSCMRNYNPFSGPIQHIDRTDLDNYKTGHGMICIHPEELPGQEMLNYCHNCYYNCFFPGKTCPNDCYCRWFNKYQE